MNASQNPATYDSTGRANAPEIRTSAAHRWPRMLVTFAATYYLLSALTLPFVNKIWLGEIPLLALFQLPKSVLKSVVHPPLLSAMGFLGLSYGSASPDYGATHGWAMAIMVTLPALLIVGLLLMPRQLLQRRILVVVILVCAGIDAVVTLWFDSVSHFKLYNASYF